MPPLMTFGRNSSRDSARDSARRDSTRRDSRRLSGALFGLMGKAPAPKCLGMPIEAAATEVPTASSPAPTAALPKAQSRRGSFGQKSAAPATKRSNKPGGGWFARRPTAAGESTYPEVGDGSDPAAGSTKATPQPIWRQYSKPLPPPAVLPEPTSGEKSPGGGAKKGVPRRRSSMGDPDAIRGLPQSLRTSLGYALPSVRPPRSTR